MAAFREYSEKYKFRERSETPDMAIALSMQVGDTMFVHSADMRRFHNHGGSLFLLTHGGWLWCLP